MNLKKSDIKSQLEKISILEQLLKIAKNEMLEIIELENEIKSVISEKIYKTFSEYLDDIENEINTFDEELTYLLSSINKLQNENDKKIIIELYINRKSLEEIKNKFNIPNDSMNDLLNQIYIELAGIFEREKNGHFI